MSQSFTGPVHGAENADHELKVAYNCVMDIGTVFQNQREHPGARPDDLMNMYRHAYNAFRKGDRLAAERWARSVKHLARAFWHEAKIAYCEGHVDDVPFLENAIDDYQLRFSLDATIDLIESVIDHIPAGSEQMPADMSLYIRRARDHIRVVENPDYKNELLRVERIKAAHQYGRVVECLALAHEADNRSKKAA